MNQVKNERVFSIIAGVLFLLHGGYLILRMVSYYIDKSYFNISFLNVLWWCIYIGLGILLLIGKKNVGFLIAFGAACISDIYFLVNYLIYTRPSQYAFFGMRHYVAEIVTEIFDIAIYALLFIFIFLYIIPGLRRNIGIIKNLWFLPAVLSMVRSVIEIINYFSGLALLIYVVETVGILFISLWLKSSLPEKESSVSGQNPYTAYQMPPKGNPYIPYQSQPSGNSYTSYQPHPSGNPYVTAQSQQAGNSGKKVQEEVEQLKAYKELLDSGVLTQEEFDAKKKEILGL